MQTVSKVCVIGLGTMGRVYLERFRISGLEVRGIVDANMPRATIGEAELLVLALRAGADALRVLANVNICRKAAIWNVTTQAIPESRECAELAASRGFGYYGGGVTGGASDAAAGCAGILIGPPPPAAIAGIAGLIGQVIVYPDAAAATAAKLLHNLVLILQNHVIAASLQLAGASGVDNLASVLDIGTAGRKPSESSAARDYTIAPRSSYTCRLVAKDLRALLGSFAELRKMTGINLEELAAFYEAGGDAPYTGKALRSLEGKS